ncbi:MAG: helix-turn-helix domain-containing protein [Candidatus Omnitrophica bacterium]|nr:helix-turn-helix domain-containing protein [Candidatus Omnitrophota bacterium]
MSETEKPSHEYLSIREAAELLEISEDELRGLVDRHQVPRHTIAGAFLRLRKDEVEALKNKWRIQRELFPKIGRYFAHQSTVSETTLKEKLKDFWYFNDFYVICGVIIVFLLLIIISS